MSPKQDKSGTRRGLYWRYLVLQALTVSVVFLTLVGAGLFIYKRELRIQAVALSNHVVAFRRWIANTGGVWVDKLHPDYQDFLAAKTGLDGSRLFQKNPALATRELSEIYASLLTGTQFRVTSDNLRNKKNSPNTFENGAIALFKKNDALSYVEGFSLSGYRYAQPIKITKPCLKCHGKPEDAPKAVIEKYGADRAFGYAVGDTRGIISILIPPMALRAALSELSWVLLFGGALTVSVFALNLFWFRTRVFQPLRDLTSAVHQISSSGLPRELSDEPLAGVPIPTDVDDEMSALARSFNEMTEKLSASTISRDYANDVFNSIADSLIVADDAGTITNANFNTVESTGQSRDHLIGTDVSHLFPDLTVVDLTSNQLGLATSMIKSNSQLFDVEISVAQTRNFVTGGRQWIISARNVEAQNAAKRILSSFFKLSPSPVAVTAMDSGKHVEVNDRWLEVLGYSREEIIGKSGVEIGHWVDEADRERILADTKAVGAVRNYPGALYAKNGEVRQFLFSTEQVHINGKAHLIWGCNDVTEFRRSEAALRDAKDEAEDANNAKSQFLANMSHELRTPLNSIIGFSDAIKHGYAGTVPAKAEEYVGLINRSSLHLLEVVNDLLDMSKISDDLFSLNRENFLINELVGECVAEVKAGRFYNAQNLTVHFDDERKQMCFFFGDRTRVRQVFLNLLTNALKFCPEGKIEISLSFDDHRLTCVVRDTGGGMTQDEIKHAMKPFGQVDDDAYTRATEGTGLGLPISKRLVELHGGVLTVESEKGVGTEVHFWLPQASIDDQFN